ncbi:MAG: hypothetical protein FWG70_10455 [Oscillospiraceae bacterium]|nr:hypothetical protein [Oscillospiraceae bacterium]
MKIRIFAILIVLFLFCSCGETPISNTADEGDFGAALTDETEEPAEEEPDPELEPDNEPKAENKTETYFNTLENGFIEINLTKLTNGSVTYYADPIDDRYIAVCTSGSEIFIIDIFEKCVVYSEKLKGLPGGWFEPFSINGVNGVSMESYIETTTEHPFENEYYINYFTPENSWFEKRGQDSRNIEFGDKILREIDFGIFEDRNGELTELLPPIPEENKFYYGENNEAWEVAWEAMKSTVVHRFETQIDENRFLYTMIGYESAPGFGIYDFTTETYAHIPDTQQLFFMQSIDNNLYFFYQEYGSETDSFYRLDSDTLELEKILDMKEFIAEQNLPFSYPTFRIDKIYAAFSEDGKFITFAIYNGDRFDHDFETKYQIYVLDLSDNTVINTYYFESRNSTDASPQFMGDSLLLYGQKISGRDEYMYIIPL